MMFLFFNILLKVFSKDHFNITRQYKSYALLENLDLQKRTIENIRNEYQNNKNALDKLTDSPSFNISSLTQISLKILNFYRGLAGLSQNITEDKFLSQQCYKEVNKIQENPSKSNLQIAQKGKFLVWYSNSLNFELLNRLFIDEKGKNAKNEVKNRRIFLRPNMNRIGIAFSIPKEENENHKASTKQLLTVIKFDDKRSNKVSSGLDFVSWPPEGPFPLDQLPSIWHVSHPDFFKAAIDDLRIFAYRDDNHSLKIKNQFICSDSLIFEVTEESLKQCKIGRTVTVAVFNDRLKKIYRFSVRLFDVNEVTDSNLERVHLFEKK